VRRQRGVRLLAAIGDKRAVGPLLETLPSDVHKDRGAGLGVAAALEALGDDRAIDALCEAALDVRRPAARRREAAEALAVFRDPRAIEVLKKLEKDPEFGFVAAYGLFRLTGDTKALARMRELHGGQIGSADALRMAAKCESPRILDLMFDALEKGDPAAQPAVVALLRQRFWKQAEPRVRAHFMGRARAAAPDEFTLTMLGELGGDDAVVRLMELTRTAKGKLWDNAARALAETGDPRAVRHFNRMSILERDEHRREVAKVLHRTAAKRQAERSKKQ
jgi:HEAT repeat protein